MMSRQRVIYKHIQAKTKKIQSYVTKVIFDNGNCFFDLKRHSYEKCNADNLWKNKFLMKIKWSPRQVLNVEYINELTII